MSATYSKKEKFLSKWYHTDTFTQQFCKFTFCKSMLNDSMLFFCTSLLYLSNFFFNFTKFRNTSITTVSKNQYIAMYYFSNVKRELYQSLFQINKQKQRHTVRKINYTDSVFYNQFKLNIT